MTLSGILRRVVGGISGLNFRFAYRRGILLGDFVEAAPFGDAADQILDGSGDPRGMWQWQ